MPLECRRHIQSAPLPVNSASGGAVAIPTLIEGDVHRFEVGMGTRKTLFRRTLVDNQMLGLA
jgi:hypothetical protein